MQPDYFLFSSHYEPQKLEKVVKSLTNLGSGGEGRNFIIHFVRRRLVLPFFYSVLFTPAMWN
jgi:hypothetical protein